MISLPDDRKASIAEDIFRKMVLKRAEDPTEYDALRLDLTNDVVLRTPHLWLLLFSDRGCGRRSFVKEDGVRGSLVVAFEENVARSYSGRSAPPYTLDAEDSRLAVRLTSAFRAVGVMWSGFNLSMPGDEVDEATFRATSTRLVNIYWTHLICWHHLLEVLEPLIVQAKELLQELTANLLDRKGASGSKYKAFAHLEPSRFPASERDAIKRAST